MSECIEALLGLYVSDPFLLSYSFWPVCVKHFVCFLGSLRSFISVV